MLIYSPCHRVPPMYLALEGALHDVYLYNICVIYFIMILKTWSFSVRMLILEAFVSFNSRANINNLRLGL